MDDTPARTSDVESSRVVNGNKAGGVDGTVDSHPPAEMPLLPAGTPQKQLPPPSPPPQARDIPPHRLRSRWLWFIVACSLVIGVAAYLLWPKIHKSASSTNAKSGKGGGGRGGGGIPNVVASRARRGNIGVYFTGLGAVTPLNTVTVKSRVDGELMTVNYHEGEIIHKGDVLVEIDPRPYQAAVMQAEGALMRDEATLENAKIDLVRYQTLVKTKSIPEQQLATQQATVKQDEGIVKSDQGSLETARVNLAYTKITSPLTGRAGLRLVDSGNIVHASDANGLVVITQVDPMSVLFTVSEDQLPQVVQKTQSGQKLPVDAYDREMKTKLATGTLATIDNEIDPTTGTVKLRAIFDNPKGTLFPDQFVNARLLIEEHRGVTLLSNAAIQRTTNSTFVYLVKPDSTVTMRTITIGASDGDVSEIKAGLNPGDVAVTSGADKLEEGGKVHAEIPGEPAPQTQSSAQPSKSGAKTQSKSRGGKP
jgi:membrane fusion protein, multidrug efflux system